MTAVQREKSLKDEPQNDNMRPFCVCVSVCVFVCGCVCVCFPVSTPGLIFGVHAVFCVQF